MSRDTVLKKASLGVRRGVGQARTEVIPDCTGKQQEAEVAGRSIGGGRQESRTLRPSAE